MEHNIPGKVANLSHIFDANGEAAKENGPGGYGVRFVVFPDHKTKALISESSWFLFLVKFGPCCKIAFRSLQYQSYALHEIH